MSTARRQNAYHHGDLRQTLIDAAVRHIDQEGTEGLSLRALAREAGVSATAPYRHFESRTALLAAIATQGFEELDRAMIYDPERLRREPLMVLYEAGLTYVDYARRNMVKYHLMFGDAIGDFSPYADLLAAAEASYGRFEGILEGGVAAGALEAVEIRELGGTLWSLVHGLAGVTMAGERKREQVPPENLLALPPLQAQQRILDAPERALVRLMGGLVTDAEGFAAVRRRAGIA
jgi:AcrR family transcriptional regulator